MSLINKEKGLTTAKGIALVGIMAATLECAKLVLSFLPNIEVVTLLCALYGYVFGIYGVIATAVFVCIEPLIWGVGSWIISYFIHWPLVALIFMLLGRAGVKKRIPLTAIAVGLTFGFGLLSSVIDCGFYLGFNENYFKNLPIYYARGAIFYAVHIFTNLVVFPTLFPFLSKNLDRIKQILHL